MRLVILLGSGASIGAGMPSVGAITDRVTSGDRVIRHTDARFYLVDEIKQHHDVAHVHETVGFLRELKALCDSYFAVHDPERETNYEDLAYVARQIDDAIGFEYENPALAPLIEQLVGGVYSGRNIVELQTAASLAADYIEDIVCGLLGGRWDDLSYLGPISDAFADGAVDQLDLFTLNHDRVIETHLREIGTRFSDGFEREHGTLHLWCDTYGIPHRRVFKLHGSIDWYRYPLVDLDGWSGQVTARANGDPTDQRGPDRERLGYPAGGRPRLLTGTFNKILAYPSDVFADQHFRFHEALAAADHVLVIGFGFGDKAINSRLIAWAERPGRRRMVIAHRDPDGLGEGARGAIQGKWRRWNEAGLLGFVPRHLEHTSWPELSEALGG